MIKKLFDRTFWKFILVGLVNTAIGSGIMFLLYNVFHCSYWISSAANYVIGSIVSFFLNKNFTFQHKGYNWKVILKFIINIAVCYLIAYGIAKPLAVRILEGQSKNLQENIAMLVGMCIFVGLNYLSQRFIVFKKNKE
ncbi:MAG: GtrA family protein [Oscillospiraceae bacterium]|nr:GtrA family protein [Oscillospiraceae bacterium]